MTCWRKLKADIELLTSTERRVTLHGDLHHFNILSAQREPWLAIDPKGLIGDTGFEVAAFLRNPSRPSQALLTRRLDILVDALALDRERTRKWCFAEAMLNAAWSHEEGNPNLADKIEWARMMEKM